MDEGYAYFGGNHCSNERKLMNDNDPNSPLNKALTWGMRIIGIPVRFALTLIALAFVIPTSLIIGIFYPEIVGVIPLAWEVSYHWIIYGKRLT
jgi:hypothetical protein